MSNEFLCRGKRVDTHRWVDGYYVKLLVNAVEEAYLHLIIGKNDGQYNSVDFETVGRYTELTDKNGVKIFKGDILRDVNNNDLYIVECGHTAFGFDVRIIDEEDPYWTTFYDVGIDEDHNRVTGAVVIGNIHDNPELLGDKNYETN